MLYWDGVYFKPQLKRHLEVEQKIGEVLMNQGAVVKSRLNPVSVKGFVCVSSGKFLNLSWV